MSTEPIPPTRTGSGGTGSGGTGDEGRGSRSRTAIEQAAVRLFAQRGYRGTSLAAIAASAELSQPGLLHHFPTKEHLLLQILERRDQEDHQQVDAALSAEGLGLLPALRELVARNQTTRELVQLFTVLLGESVGGDHPAHPHFVERYRTVRQHTVGCLERGQRAGEIREDADLDGAAAVIIAVMDGLQIQWLLDPEVDMVTGFQTLADALTQYLARPPRARGHTAR